jgi:hypothetical protein
MNAKDFWDAMEEVELHLGKREREALLQKLDPSDTGVVTLVELARETGKGGGKLKVLESEEETRLRDFQRDLLNYMQSENVDLQERLEKLDSNMTGIVDEVDFQKELMSLMQNDDVEEEMKLIRKKYDPQGRREILYVQFC